MRFTFSWLKRFLQTSQKLDDILGALNSLGLEVEDVILPGKELESFKIARIVEAVPHPSADKLRVCTVDDGQSMLQIVCGAENARGGIKVVLAPLGAIIPANNIQITVSKIRGVESFGMLCSGDELLLKDYGGGIIELEEDAPVGSSFAKYYDLDDAIIEVSITPNRGDCLGVYGIARDLAAKGFGSLCRLEIPEIKEGFTADIDITVEDEKHCSLFIGRQINGIANKESPIWLKNLLRNSGLKPISAVVDITNYICHSFAQPMHAFDADKIDSINVRMASSGQSFDALNDKTYKLSSEDIVLSDRSGVHSLAGIIGGKSSSTTIDTVNVFLEAACFDKELIMLTSRRCEIITQSKLRFERHVDYNWRLEAFKIASFMIFEICGGVFSDIKVLGQAPLSRKIEFYYADFEKKIGFVIETPLINEILQRLGYKVDHQSEDLAIITVPSWRSCQIPEDILEEIVRIYGYDQIVQRALPQGQYSYKIPVSVAAKQIASNAISSIGYHEAVTWSFMSSSVAKNFGQINSNLSLVNPISSDLNYLRSSIVPNLLDGILKNQNRSIKDLKFFEIGPIFSGVEVKDELTCLTAVATGSNTGLNPHEKNRPLDVFDLKGDLELVLKEFDIAFDEIEIRKTLKTYYHPNVAGDMFYLGKDIGSFGAIHPRIIKNYGINNDVFAFEVLLSELQHFKQKPLYSIYEFQPVERDFAFIIDESLAVGDILTDIKKVDEMIKGLKVFDIYKGAGIEDGKKSVAINVLLKAKHTLLSDEINDVCQRIIDLMKNRYFAQLRG